MAKDIFSISYPTFFWFFFHSFKFSIVLFQVKLLGESQQKEKKFNSLQLIRTMDQKWRLKKMSQRWQKKRKEARAWWRINLGTAYIVSTVILNTENKLVFSVSVHSQIKSLNEKLIIFSIFGLYIYFQLYLNLIVWQ